MKLLHIHTYHSKKYLSFLFLAACLFCLHPIKAQTRSEFSIAAGGIFSQLEYNLPQNSYIDNSYGGGIGLGYSFYLNPQWSINIEGEYERFKANALLNSLQVNTNATDMEGENFEFRYTANHYNEEQKLDVINIPLTVQFQTDGETKFYARIGGQVSIIANAEYTTSIRSLTTSGYYAQYDAELFDPMFMGFGTFNNLNQESKELDLDTSFAAVMEAGIKREAGESNSLYIGFFLDYGLNTINGDTENTNLVEYTSENPTDFNTNSVLSTSMAEDVKLISYGLKLRFAFGGF